MRRSCPCPRKCLLILEDIYGKKLQRNRPESIEKQQWQLPRNNEYPHTAKTVRQFLVCNELPNVPQKFQTREEISAKLQEVLLAEPKNAYQTYFAS